MKIIPLIIIFFALTGCATEESSVPETADHPGVNVLTAGQSVILPADTSALVPFGTFVRNPNGTSVTIDGHRNRVNASAGVLIKVPADAIGPADNLVIVKPTKSAETATNPDELSRLRALSAEIRARQMQHMMANPAALQYTPEVRMQSRAGDVLFHDLINAPGGVGMIDRVLYPNAMEREIVKIKVIVPYDNKMIGEERWIISHSDSDAVPYVVILAPDGHGGTNFAVKSVIPKEASTSAESLRFFMTPNDGTAPKVGSSYKDFKDKYPGKILSLIEVRTVEAVEETVVHEHGKAYDGSGKLISDVTEDRPEVIFRVPTSFFYGMTNDTDRRMFCIALGDEIIESHYLSAPVMGSIFVLGLTSQISPEKQKDLFVRLSAIKSVPAKQPETQVPPNQAPQANPVAKASHMM